MGKKKENENTENPSKIHSRIVGQAGLQSRDRGEKKMEGTIETTRTA